MMEREGEAASVLACSEKSGSRLHVSLKHVLLGICSEPLGGCRGMVSCSCCFYF